MNLQTAIKGLLITLTAEGYSPRTNETYELHLKCLTDYFHNPEVDTMTAVHLREWLVWLRDEYKTRRGKQLTSKSVYNHWTSMRRFFRFAHEEQLVKENPALAVKAPRYQSPSPDPFTADEIERILKGCVAPRTKTAYQNRSRLIVVMLVDTGIRASELLGLNLGDIDLKRQRMLVLGKGNKKRYIPFGNATRRYMWRYLSERGEKPGPLFISYRGERLSLNALENMFRSLGKRAEIVGCYPHRFRHTFAVNFLCNGGDAITLQNILGHTSLDMVSRYVRLSQQNVDEIHRRSSPADKMGL